MAICAASALQIDDLKRMSKDFAKRDRSRAATRPKPQSKVPGWVWLFTGTVLGAFIMFLVRLSEMPTSDQPEETSTPATASQEQKQKEQPRFDFYTILKESKVPVPVIEPSPTAPPSPEEEYVLQVASFKKVGDAEQLRAELILMNLEATVETAKVRNGEVWHRVLVGPFGSRSNLAKARSILVSNDLEALVLKRAPRG